MVKTKPIDKTIKTFFFCAKIHTIYRLDNITPMEELTWVQAVIGIIIIVLAVWVTVSLVKKLFSNKPEDQFSIWDYLALNQIMKFDIGLFNAIM